jgi:hypothetical protein
MIVMVLNSKVLESLLEGYERPQRKCVGLTESEKALTRQLLAELDEIEALQAAKAAKEQQTIEEYLEAEKQELVFECDKKIALVNSILNDETTISFYGNDTVVDRLNLINLVESIPTNHEDSLLILTMDAYDCDETQALTKIALALNITNANEDCWFNKQLEVINYNNAILANPEQIAEKYPKVYSKIKEGDRTQRGYYTFLMDAFMAKIHRRGLFFEDKNAPLVTAESFRTVSTTLHVRMNTAFYNMNDLHNFGFTRKLTDEQLKKMSTAQYGEIKVFQRKMKHMAAHVKTITNYELVKWTDEVLAYAEEQIKSCKSKKVTHMSQNYFSMKAAGYSDTVSKKIDEQMNKKDKENIEALKKWARKKYEKTGRHFITNKEWEEQFNNPDKKNSIYAGKKKREAYRAIVLSSLDLVAVYATKDCREALQSTKKCKNQKFWENIKPQGHVYIKREMYEGCPKVFSLVK